jgi:hypothetical protein
MGHLYGGNVLDRRWRRGPRGEGDKAAGTVRSAPAPTPHPWGVVVDRGHERQSARPLPDGIESLRDAARMGHGCRALHPACVKDYREKSGEVGAIPTRPTNPAHHERSPRCPRPRRSPAADCALTGRALSRISSARIANGSATTTWAWLARCAGACGRGGRDEYRYPPRALRAVCAERRRA